MIEDIVNKTRKTLIAAASYFREDQIAAYETAIYKEKNKTAKWILENILENAKIAAKNKSPLCDDTGIPHVILEVGPESNVTSDMLESIRHGIAVGLEDLPGRPMAVVGNDIERLEQSRGLSPRSQDLVAAPVMIMPGAEKGIKLNILMEGGGPEIRSKTFRVFHRHDVRVIQKEIISWAMSEVGNLGCTPCTLAIGIGRTHYEASSLMLQAMIKGDFGRQTHMERQITEEINASNVGPLGIGGDTTVLATFLQVGPQRASGVRIVSLRPCCCFEPRTASTLL